MEILEVPVIDNADETYIKNSTAVIVCLFNVNVNYNRDVFEIIEQIEKLDSSLRGASLSHVTSLRASFCFYRPFTLL